ncbi:hypothetical protein SCLCIDRAFT_29657 [Scleroderma citrinum Foug A]|uniref:CxC1-like cysteine cluster associated with KDZ transposases domain-containing protein n=1 Tax=Scleroderma citrinum Foug A TaxID=1036808 RepID=A0A0C3D6M5_9AGAM|nr:hypothetical protein SCLCIDRAFT_29657 [Scleroderma citrinum Foug A]
MSDPRPTRSSQAITTKGLGQHFTRPRKPRNKKRKLHDLLAASSEPKQSPSTKAASPILQSDELLQPDELLEVPPMELEDMIVMSDVEDVSHGATTQRVCTICPTARSIAACAGWKGGTVRDPFRRGLSQAAQWYNILQVEVEKRVDGIIQQCRLIVKPAIELLAVPPSSPFFPTVQQHSLSQGSCAEILVQRCPACFGGTLFGRPLDEGGDIHVATHGNFHHRHRRSAGDCPPFYEPTYFIPKAQVDAIGRHITCARQHPSKLSQSTVPDEAIDQCESSYEATDSQKQKTAMDNFDDTGVMALICRHDIPLFFTNIDTPGEQQKYSVALISHIFSLLPHQANLVVLYDVGCVLACSLSQFNILDQQIMSQLRFATTAMHAYGHEWACQLVYNPHITSGLGLSDGEGTERLWSRFIKLIGIEWVSSCQRRIWLLDRQADAIGYKMWRELGDWLRCRLQKGIGEQGSTAYAPARVKKELNNVLALQADLDSSSRVLQLARATIEKGNMSSGVLDALASLERSHARLVMKTEALYSSLNVHDRIPELKDISLEFVQILLMARDLKINIRKRAVGSFFEWDKPLGTKLHQQTRKAITKRQPALMAAIRKYNSYCKQLSQLDNPTWAIPLPAALPTTLVDLRNDVTLMQDVWITPSTGDIP